ncbi:HI1506-related protein [Mesorhizobium sp. M0437]|uniref:HI1506-related protein n=1 Tax=Mesorhizobium sp. M0437 TaxID=2956945 RepID=UPI00333B0855
MAKALTARNLRQTANAAPVSAAAAETTNSEGVTASAASPTTAAPTNAAVEPSGPAVVEHGSGAPSPQAAGTISEATKPVIADQNVAVNASPAAGAAPAAAPPAAPSLGAATGTISSIPPESVDQGGAGNTAGSAESLTLEDLDKRLGTAEDEFRSKFPRLAAAIDAWQAANAEGDVPTGVRIRSKVDGFRRAGIAHSKAPVEHAMEAFKGPEQLEALFAEPNLVVELI